MRRSLRANRRGQFSILAAMFVAVILISSVMMTYQSIRYGTNMDEPQILSAIDETNLALKQVLGFTVGYYGSVLQVTGNSTYAHSLADKYLLSGLQNVADIRPEWGSSFTVTGLDLSNNWFMNESFSRGTLNVTYALTGLQVSGIAYSASMGLGVDIFPSSSTNKVCLNVTEDGVTPISNLGLGDFQFYRYRYNNLTWEMASPTTQPVAFSNGTYIIDIPPDMPEINPYAYLIQVKDTRGIFVSASSYSKYTASLTFNSTFVGDADYVDGYALNVDNFTNVGSHTAFGAQQNGPDSIYDTLTEGVSGTVTNDYSPDSYNPISASLISGSPANLAADDGSTITFGSQSSSLSSQELYTHSETTSIGGQTYYMLMYGGADAAGTTVVQPMTSSRVLLAKSVFSLQGVSSIPSSTWNMTYRAWQDPTINGTPVNNATSTSGGWTNPANAYADGGSYASSTASDDRQVYGNYSLTVPANATGLQLRVRLDAWCPSGDDNVKLEASANGGLTWLPTSVTYDLPASDQNNYYVNLTSWTTWTPASIGALTLRVTHVGVGSADEVRLDWIPVEVTYTIPSVLNDDPTSSSGGWSNPANANADGGSAASSSTDGNQQVYTGYGFSVPANATVTQVRVRVDAYRSGGDGNDQLIIGAYDGVWLSSTSTLSLATSEASYWVDITGWSSGGWTTAELSSIAVRVNHLRNGASTDTLNLDWLPVEVTYSLPRTLSNYPTSNSAGWSNAANANADGGSYASSTSDGDQQVYSGYGFSLPGGATVTQVRVRVDSYRSGGDNNDQLLIGVSDGVWLSSTSTLSLTTSETTQWVDITGWSASGWNTTELSSLAVRVSHSRVGSSTDTLYLDWIPVEVTYTLPTVDPNFPSSNSAGWTNPTNAYAEGGTFAYTSNDGDQQGYGGFGFSLSGVTITQVRVRVDAYLSGGDDQLLVGASDGTWLATTSTLSLGTSETTQWVDITGWSSGGWTTTELGNIALRVSHVRVGGATEQINLDYVMVEVSYNASPTVDTNNPTLTTPSFGSWTYPTRAYSDDSYYAYCSSNNVNQRYGSYGYSLSSSAVVTQVRVRMDAWCPSGDDDIKLEVSTDGGSNWLAASYTQSLGTSQTTYWIDVTSWATWTYSMVNNIYTKVTYVQVGGTASQVRLDYIPVEVTYYVPTVTTRNPTSVSSGWTNPTNAYADSGGYASSTIDDNQQIYSGFGFAVPSGATITQVRVRLDAYRSGGDGNDQILLGVSNGNWLSTTHAQSLTTTESTYWIDVTGWASWSQAGVNGISIRVVHDRYGTSTDTLNLDCIQVEVTYASASSATDSPSADSEGWSNPANAYVDGGGYASSTIDGSQQVYNGFGFSVPSNATITQVRVRLDAYRSGGDGNDDIVLGVSYGSWSTATQEQGLTTSEATYWIDVTSWATWTPTGVNSIATRIAHVRYGTLTDEVRLDCFQVEVSYTLPTLLTNNPSSNSAGWLNPTNAYVDGGSYSSSPVDGDQTVYGGYSFTVPSNATITQVRIRLDAFRVSGGDNNDRILLGVSNGNWQGNTTEVTLGNSESTIWVDVTGYASWTPANINSIQQRLSHVRYGSSTEELRLDYLQVEVTYSTSVLLTNNPTSNSCWTNPTNAYVDAGSYAASTGNSDRQVFGGYNFSIQFGASLSRVRVRLDAWVPSGDDDVMLEVSVDGGANWLATTHTYNLPSSDQNNYYVDITSWTTWTLAKLNNDSIRTRVTHIASGASIEEVRLDWIPVEVTYSVATTAHLDADVLIRNADGTVNATIATAVAPSADLSSAQQTLWGTYAFPGRTITSQSAYLEIDYYAEVSSVCSLNAYLRLDDNSLGNSSQTRISNMMLPSEQACTVEFYGPSNTHDWNSLFWNMSSLASTSGVSVTYQLYNNQTHQYPVSGDGYMNTTLGTTKSKSEGWVNASAANFRDAIGRWSLKVTAVKGTSSPFTITLDMAKFSPGSATYGLDLEENWANLSQTVFQPTLCIKTGNLSSETLAVDFWNATEGAHWQNIFSGLTANGWNNKSIAITPPSFYIRFRNMDAEDYSPSTWQLDAVLIRSSSHQEVFQSLSGAVVTLELLQNGTMRWLGQDSRLLDVGGSNITGIPIPPVPVCDIHVNQTTLDGHTSEVPFQIEDWGSNYNIPLGMTNNQTVFGNRQMIVSLLTTRISQVTVWWNGSDSATQTPLAYTNRYFQNDNTVSNTLTNGLLKMQIDQTYDSADQATVFRVTSTVGDSQSASKFMRVNGDNSTYGAAPAYVIHHGVVRDIVQQESEWSNGIPNCPNVYSNIVLTLPANATYFTYQTHIMFLSSAQARNITDLCPIKVQSLVNGVVLETENGVLQSDPIISNASGTFLDTDNPGWTSHHWSQLINNTGAGVGIMFTDAANLQLYAFDALAGNSTGGLRVNNSTRTLELMPVSGPSVSFTNARDLTWYGAVATFSSAVYPTTGIPIYKTIGQINSGLWILAELPPTITVTTGN